jgi:hypothetical protein
MTSRDLVLMTPLRARAMPLGLDARNGHEAPQVRSNGQSLLDYQNQAAIRDLFKVAYDTTGAAAVRRAKIA